MLRDNVAIARDGLPAAQLTTVSLNGLTAWAALKELALEPGQTLVIAGAAGSVGGFRVGTRHGARDSGVCRSLGA